MDKNIQFENAEPQRLDALREMQLNELNGPVQEYNEEGIVTYNANFVRIVKQGKTTGYACIGTHEQYKDIILEYYLLPPFRRDSLVILKQLAEVYGCKQWTVNTQDFFALPVLLELGLKYAIDAYLFTVDPSVDVAVGFGPGVSFGQTGKTELQEIYELVTQDGFYTGGGVDSVKARLAGEELYSLRQAGKLIGTGFVSRLQRTPAYADIAMIINPSERHKGWGVQLVRALIGQCTARGMAATAVCSVDNPYSRKTLEKAGFTVSGCILLAEFHQ
jgi:GNAT superfamily N-acetyltransferase